MQGLVKQEEELHARIGKQVCALLRSQEIDPTKIQISGGDIRFVSDRPRGTLRFEGVDFAGWGALRDRVHGLAVEKGWWEASKETSSVERLMLVISELCEAVECHRDGDLTLRVSDSGKPEGIQIEIADAAIRILDFLGGQDWHVDDIEVGETAWPACNTPTEWAAFISSPVQRAIDVLQGMPARAWQSIPVSKVDDERVRAQRDLVRRDLAAALNRIVLMAGAMDFDLFAHIDLKHEYNTTRPHRHGGKVI